MTLNKREFLALPGGSATIVDSTVPPDSLDEPIGRLG
jgi:hypothetical protein